MNDSEFQQIVAEVRRFGTTATDLAALQEFTVSRLAERLPQYNWVGFYMLDPSQPDVLVLGPFRGAPTEHVRIPVAQGNCGAAVAQGETIVIDDVTSDPRYLACSLDTKSEIVVPIRVKGGHRRRDRHRQPYARRPWTGGSGLPGGMRGYRRQIHRAAGSARYLRIATSIRVRASNPESSVGSR